jgi:hypothetical protein
MKVIITERIHSFSGYHFFFLQTVVKTEWIKHRSHRTYDGGKQFNNKPKWNKPDQLHFKRTFLFSESILEDCTY